MNEQVIPDTDSVQVAEIAVAWAIVKAASETKPQNGPSLDKLIELYRKALKAVHNAQFEE